MPSLKMRSSRFSSSIVTLRCVLASRGVHELLGYGDATLAGNARRLLPKSEREAHGARFRAMLGQTGWGRHDRQLAFPS